MTNEPIGWIATFNVKDAASFSAVAKEAAEAVEKTEPGTVLYEWLISDDESTVTTVEWFNGLASAKEHLKGVTMTTYMPKIFEHGEISSLHVYGNPDEELRGMLAGLNPAGIDKQLCGFSRLGLQATV